MHKIILAIILAAAAPAFASDWTYTLEKDAMTDKPSGGADLAGEDSQKTFMVITCDHQNKAPKLSYRFYFTDGFGIDFASQMTTVMVRVDEKPAKTFSLSAPTDSKFKTAFWNSSVRPHLVGGKTAMFRFKPLFGTEQTVKFNLEGFAGAEAKMKAHCGVK